MAIPTPTIPSAVQAVSAVALKSTQNNKAFSVYSGEIGVTSTETTMISINDIGKRDIILCLELGAAEVTSVNFTVKVKSNGQIIYIDSINHVGEQSLSGYNELKIILHANTSLEVTLKSDSSSVRNMCVAGYGYYMEHI